MEAFSGAEMLHAMAARDENGNTGWADKGKKGCAMLKSDAMTLLNSDRSLSSNDGRKRRISITLRKGVGARPGRRRSAAGLWCIACSFGLWLAILSASAAYAVSDNTWYQYDARGQLTSITYSNGTVITYTYDNAGNRTGETVSCSGSGC